MFSHASTWVHALLYSESGANGEISWKARLSVRRSVAMALRVRAVQDRFCFRRVKAPAAIKTEPSKVIVEGSGMTAVVNVKLGPK